MEIIFVFGSNKAGRHGAGAAKRAKEFYGAVYGRGVGLQGKSYAIPTKDANLKTLPVGKIARYVNDFKDEVKAHSDKLFYVTRVGCGLAGYSDKEIAPLFIGAESCCIFPEQWREYLGDGYNYFSGQI